MDLFEYQARDMFEAHGVPVLAGQTATTPEEAKAAAEQIGAKSGGVTVVKAQVKTGGRGKAGGVKVAKSADEAEQYAKDILGMDIKGHTVGTVMIAQGAKIAEEYYFSILLDRANRSYLAMCSKEGGVEIEQLAVERPEALARVAVDPQVGIDAAKVSAAQLAQLIGRIQDGTISNAAARQVFEVTDGFLEQFGDVVVEERVVDVPAVARAKDQAQMPQQPQMVRCGRLSDVQLFAEVGHGARLNTQRAQNAQPHRRGQRLHDLSETFSIRHGQGACFPTRLSTGHAHHCALRPR